MNEIKTRAGWSRRSALTVAGAAAFSLAAPGILRAQSATRLIMATGGGKLDDAYRKTLFTPFKQKTGLDVITTGNEGARLKAMVEQGRTEWDLIQGPAEGLIVYARQGLLEPIDFGGIPRDKMIPGTMHDHLVLTDLAAYCIGWNTKGVKSNPPKTWKDLWALDGRIGLWKKPFQTLEVALMADGVAPKDLYPLDVDRAFASLAKIKSKLVWWNTGAQGAQILLDGEIDAGSIWNGRVHDPKVAGAPVDFHFNQSVLVSDAWGVPKGAPNKAKAMELLAFGLASQQQAEFAKVIPYGPVNKDALPLLDDKTKAVLPVPGADNVLLNIEYWADNGPKLVERFDKWLLS